MITVVTNWLGIAFWSAFAGLWLARLAVNFDIASLVLFLDSFLAAVLLALRRSPRREGSAWEKLLAWAASVAPLAAFSGDAPGRTEGLVLQTAALAWTVTSMAFLGRSFGIAPADRGLVTGGPYRLVRHPMYAGEIVALAGFTLAHLSLRNALALLALSLVQAVRALREEKVLDSPEYRGYGRKVRWRLFPFVW